MLAVFLSLFSAVNADKISANCGEPKSFAKWQSASPPAAEFSLVQAHTFIRHGDRTISSDALCWSDLALAGDWNCSQTVRLAPHNSDRSALHSQWMEFQLAHLEDSQLYPGNCLNGQLTFRGYQRHIENGLGLRSRYVEYYKLLPADLNQALDEAKSKGVPQKIYKIRADDVRRVIHSGMTLFTGLFAVKDSMKNYKEIELWTADKDWEYMYPNANVCPCYGEHKDEAFDSAEFQEFLANRLQPVVDALDPIMYGGVKNKDQYHQTKMVDLAYDCMTVYSCTDRPMPASVTQTLYDEVMFQASYYHYFAYGYPNVANGSLCTVGPLLKLLKDRLVQAVIDPSQATAWYLYSGHDTGPMMPMMAAIGYSHWNMWCPYASVLSFELFRNRRGTFFVQTSFEDTPLTLPKPCDCDANRYSLCSLDKFLKFISPMVATDLQCPGMHPWKSATAGGELADKMRGIFENLREKKTMSDIGH